MHVWHYTWRSSSSGLRLCEGVSSRIRCAMSEQRNPYAAPAPAAPAPAAEPGTKDGAAKQPLGTLLVGFVGLQLVGNIFFAAKFVVDTDAMRAADPLAPAWSFPARAIFAMFIAASSAGILLRRRIALHAYFALGAASIVLNVSRGVTSIPVLFGAAVAGPLIVWVLVRDRKSVV